MTSERPVARRDIMTRTYLLLACGVLWKAGFITVALTSSLPFWPALAIGLPFSIVALSDHDRQPVASHGPVGATTPTATPTETRGPPTTPTTAAAARRPRSNDMATLTVLDNEGWARAKADAQPGDTIIVATNGAAGLRYAMHPDGHLTGPERVIRSHGGWVVVS